jgi:5-methyltetrahydrofolate--homocysteine methyltransferase
VIIIGEKINTSRKSIEEAVEKRDTAFISKVAREQAEAGADYIDVNAGTFLDHEVDCLCWLVETVQSEVDLPLSLDSPNPKALSEAMKRHKGEPTVEERVEVGSELVKKLTDQGIPLEKIYVDPLIQPVSVDTSMGIAALRAINGIMKDFPGVNTICGLSNISFGLPLRHLVNRNFLALAISYGLSAAILDPTDKQLMATLLSIEMLLGRDEYCERFIDVYQSGRIVG